MGQRQFALLYEIREDDNINQERQGAADSAVLITTCRCFLSAAKQLTYQKSYSLPSWLWIGKSLQAVFLSNPISAAVWGSAVAVYIERCRITLVPPEVCHNLLGFTGVEQHFALGAPLCQLLDLLLVCSTFPVILPTTEVSTMVWLVWIALVGLLWWPAWIYPPLNIVTITPRLQKSSTIHRNEE